MSDVFRSGLEAEWVIVGAELAKRDPARMRRLLKIARDLVEVHGGDVGDGPMKSMGRATIDLGSSSDLL